jgi:hypothetical protein
VDHATCDREGVYGFFGGEPGESLACDCDEEACVGLRSITIRGGGDAENGGNFGRGGSGVSRKVERAGDKSKVGVTGLI